MTGYLSYRISLRLSKHTIAKGEQHLYRFLCYLNTAKVGAIKEINQLHILEFVKTTNPTFSTLTHRTLESIRGFLKYAFRGPLIDRLIETKVGKHYFLC